MRDVRPMEAVRVWKEMTAGSQPETGPGVREGISPPQETL